MGDSTNKVAKKVSAISADIRDFVIKNTSEAGKLSDLAKQVRDKRIDLKFANASLAIDSDPSNDVAYARAMQAATNACDTEMSGFVWAWNTAMHRIGQSPKPIEVGEKAARDAFQNVLNTYVDGMPVSADAHEAMMGHIKRLSQYCR